MWRWTLWDHVWGGEQIVGFVRSELFRDSYAERAKSAGTAAGPLTARAGRPRPVFRLSV